MDSKFYIRNTSIRTFMYVGEQIYKNSSPLGRGISGLSSSPPPPSPKHYRVRDTWRNCGRHCRRLVISVLVPAIFLFFFLFSLFSPHLPAPAPPLWPPLQPPPVVLAVNSIFNRIRESGARLVLRILSG